MQRLIPLRPGDRVEFWSGDRGGRWKPGVVEEVYQDGGNLRIEVAAGVWVVRAAKRCRKAARCEPSGSSPTS